MILQNNGKRCEIILKIYIYVCKKFVVHVENFARELTFFLNLFDPFHSIPVLIFALSSGAFQERTIPISTLFGRPMRWILLKKSFIDLCISQDRGVNADSQISQSVTNNYDNVCELALTKV